MKRRKTLIISGLSVVAALAVTLMPALPVLAQSLDYLGTNRDWHAFRYEEEGNAVCYVASMPTASLPTSVNHGDIWAFVTNRPYRNQLNQVTFSFGYEVNPDRPVTATIGPDAFQLLPDGQTVWSPDADADRRIVTAMKAGLDLTLSATSRRGTDTQYTFSLRGVTAAIDSIDQNCN